MKLIKKVITWWCVSGGGVVVVVVVVVWFILPIIEPLKVLFLKDLVWWSSFMLEKKPTKGSAFSCSTKNKIKVVPKSPN